MAVETKKKMAEVTLERERQKIQKHDHGTQIFSALYPPRKRNARPVDGAWAEGPVDGFGRGMAKQHSGVARCTRHL